MIKFILNDETIETAQPAGMVLLDFIRYHRNLKGTKIGCREGDCGACTVLVGELSGNEVNYHSATCCLMPIGNANGRHIVTIEGINLPKELTPVQQAFSDCGATQCGFCTPGFIVALTGFCLGKNEATIKNAVGSMDGNICRCTGYKSIERAAGNVAATLKENRTLSWLTANHYVPQYFAGIAARLKVMESESVASVPEPAGAPGRPHLVGGGTDLYVQKHEELIHASINFVSKNKKREKIIIEGQNCVIDASATVSDLARSTLMHDLFPNLDKCIKLVSSTPIRNMATIAGNIVNASPIGDFTIFFLALNAELEISNGVNKRMVYLRNFYKGYKELDKHPDEFIERIRFPIPAKNQVFNFEKVSKRTHLDIASVNSAALLTREGNKIITAEISAGGVGPVPLFLEKTSAWLEGKTGSPSVINDVFEIMKTEIAPISDARGSKEYKTLLLRQLIQAHLA